MVYSTATNNNIDTKIPLHHQGTVVQPLIPIIDENRNDVQRICLPTIYEESQYQLPLFKPKYTNYICMTRKTHGLLIRQLFRIFIILVPIFMIAFEDIYHFSYFMNQFNIEPIRDNTKRQTSSIEDDLFKTQYVTNNKIKLNQISQDDVLLSIDEYVKQKLSLNDTKKEIEMIKNLQFAYSSVSEMLNRPNRFPSIEDRIKIYMSNWYIPPCNDKDRISYQYSTPTTSSNITIVTVKEVAMYKHRNEKTVNEQQRMFEINSHFNGTHDGLSFDFVHALDRKIILQCTNKYCDDVIDYILPSLDRVLQLHNSNSIRPIRRTFMKGKRHHNKMNITNIPIFFQFGDKHQSQTTQQEEISNNTLGLKYVLYPNIPVIQKVRGRISKERLDYVTNDKKSKCYKNGQRHGIVVPTNDDSNNNQNNQNQNQNHEHLEPIILKLKTQRHYGGIYKVAESDTIPWELKKNMAIFRGGLTGTFLNNIHGDDIVRITEYERCQLLVRCWFSYTHSSSTLIDAKLINPKVGASKLISRYMNQSESNTGTIDLYGDYMSMNELLQYKVLILLEGNDVSSGLKWALFSNSIVMMPEPTKTSWAMEERLVPWVHYVPINVYTTNVSSGANINGTNPIVIRTDAEEKMQWILRNDRKAREIVKASTLWIADLELHPRAKNDEQDIFDEILLRYMSHFT